MATGQLRSLSFPFRTGSNGLPQPVTGALAVVEDLQALLLIEAGEIPMEPTLGGRFHGFVFESSGPILQARVAQELRTVIRQSEPRATVLAVTTKTIEDGPR